jgi:hypothetical protein
VDIDEVIARTEIQKVLWTYARGVDRGDYDIIASTYHEDGIDHHCSFSGPGFEFAEGVVERARAVPIVGQHHITNVTIEMDGDDNAYVESYFLAFHPHDDRGVPRLGIAAGRYLDHFQRREGDWKILTRQVVMDWTRNEVDGRTWDAIDGKPIQGRRAWDDDASYGFFREGRKRVANDCAVLPSGTHGMSVSEGT